MKTTHTEIQNVKNHTSCNKRQRASLGLENVAKRLRESPHPMISVQQALDTVLGNVDAARALDEVNIWDSFGRVLTETVQSPCDLPPFRASIKDGYAVIASDGSGTRNVLGGLEAGHQVRILQMIIVKSKDGFLKNMTYKSIESN